MSNNLCSEMTSSRFFCSDERERINLLCSMLLVKVFFAYKHIRSRAPSRNLKVSLKIITVSSPNTSKEPCDLWILLQSHDRNHRRSTPSYYYYTFKFNVFMQFGKNSFLQSPFKIIKPIFLNCQEHMSLLLNREFNLAQFLFFFSLSPFLT